MNMIQTETKRGRGRPATFSEPTRMAGFNLPVSTLDLLSKSVEDKNANRKEGTSAVTQNGLVDRALRAYLRTRSKKS